MNLESSRNKVVTFSKFFFGLVILVGAGMYYFYSSGILKGFGLSVAIISFVSCVHFAKRKKSKGKIESKLTVLLLSACILGLAIVFINKYKGGNAFIYGLGGGVSLVSGISYVLEMLSNFEDGVR